MWGVVGHEAPIRGLDNSVRQGRLAHAYLIVGPPHVGKMTLATRLAQVVNCLSPDDMPCGQCAQCRRISLGHHSDVTVVGLEVGGEGRARKEIGIDAVRSMQHASSLKPYEGRCRVFVVDPADRLSEEACNALLKLLEEPPPQSLLLLLATHPESLLPTIRSRCRLVELRPLPLDMLSSTLMEQHALSQEEAHRLAGLSLGCPGWALLALQDPSLLQARSDEMDRIARLAQGSLEERFGYAAELATVFFRDRDEVGEHLRAWLRWWRDLLLLKQGASEYVVESDGLEERHGYVDSLTTGQIADFIKAVHGTMDALEANANPRLALEVMMLRFPATSH